MKLILSAVGVLLLLCLVSSAEIRCTEARGSSSTDPEAPALPTYTQGHNGRPTCTVAEEIGVAWRNNFDPTRYWVCIALGSPAVSINCRPETGFVDTETIYGCVEWGIWTWTPPKDPPTLG